MRTRPSWAGDSQGDRLVHVDCWAASVHPAGEAGACAVGRLIDGLPYCLLPTSYHENSVLKAFTCHHYAVPLPPGHRFPMEKYRLLHDAVKASGLMSAVEVLPATPATDGQLLRAHDPDYLASVRMGRLGDREVRRIGFPWSPQLLERTRCSVGGTIAACRAALRDGVGVNLAGGTHHAFRDRGQGYCIFNDSVVAVRAMQAEGRIAHAVILDADVHQGNGTAAIAADDPTVFTFSIHSERNFPLRKERSDLDIGLEDGTQDPAYLEAWCTGVQRAIQLSGADLAIYIAGADPYEDDRLGRLALTKSGLKRRDEVVFEHCRRSGLPVATVMGGGYARRVQDTVEIHLQTVRRALEASRLAPRRPRSG